MFGVLSGSIVLLSGGAELMFHVPKKQRSDPAKTYSKKQEKNIAKKIGGFVTPGSGSGKIKGDVIKRGVVRVEAKSTAKKSFSITRDMINKIEEYSVPQGEIPCVVVDFIDRAGCVLDSVSVIPTQSLMTLIELAGKNE